MATNGYTGPAFPELRRRVVPVGSYIIATTPLEEEARPPRGAPHNNRRRSAWFRAFQKKKTPAPEGPGSVAGWVRGWGAGGHATRRYPVNLPECVPFRLRQKLFSGRYAAARSVSIPKFAPVRGTA